MECYTCGDKVATRCAHCNEFHCERCICACIDCNTLLCMECSDTCDSCDAPLCDKCNCIIDVCKCCNKKMLHETHKVCATCMFADWVLHKKDCSLCELCDINCRRSDTCNVDTILSGQHDCPICLESFNKCSSKEIQRCGLHVVCSACNILLSARCPVCREY